MKTKLALSALAATLVLAACSSGQDSSAPAAAPATPAPLRRPRPPLRRPTVVPPRQQHPLLLRMPVLLHLPLRPLRLLRRPGLLLRSNNGGG